MLTLTRMRLLKIERNCSTSFEAKPPERGLRSSTIKEFSRFDLFTKITKMETKLEVELVYNMGCRPE